MNRKQWVAVCAALLLAACGGGNGNGFIPAAQTPSTEEDTSSPDTTTPTTPTTPTTQTLMYEGLGNSRTLELAEANAEGAKGWRYLTSYDLGGGEAGNIYLKDSDATYTYRAATTAATSTDFLAQLNAQGAEGFKYAGPYVFAGSTVMSTIYRKDNGSASKFTYRLLPDPDSADAWLTQAKAQGAQGYYQFGAPLALTGGETVRIYEKDSSSSAVYDYAAVPYDLLLISPNDFLAQLNAQGNQGFRFSVPYVFTNNPSQAFALYEKDTTQSATFSHEATGMPSTLAGYVAQANAQGERGFTWLGPLAFPSTGETRTFYMKPSNCTGFICLGRGSFGF